MGLLEEAVAERYMIGAIDEPISSHEEQTSQQSC
jgi:hypothetical protein